MAKDHLLFKSKERKSRQEAAEFLHQLADKVSEGKLQLRQGQEEVNLNFPSGVTLEIDVKDKDKGSRGIQHKLEVEIKWFDGESVRGKLELD